MAYLAMSGGCHRQGSVTAACPLRSACAVVGSAFRDKEVSMPIAYVQEFDVEPGDRSTTGYDTVSGR